MVLGLVSNASATSCWWLGTVDSDIYNVDNYDRALNPGEPDSSTLINYSVSGMDSSHRKFTVVNDTFEVMTFFGYNEWATTADPYDTGIDVINGTVNAGSDLTVGTVGYGNTTWYQDDGTVYFPALVVVGRTVGAVNPGTDSCLLLMEGDSYLATPYIWVGRNTVGTVRLRDTSVLDLDVSAYWGLGFGTGQVTYNEGWGLVDIDSIGSKIIWDGDHTVIGDDQVQILVDAGVLVAFGGSGTVQWSYDFMGDETIITGIPEPATIALLGLGGLVLLRKRS